MAKKIVLKSHLRFGVGEFAGLVVESSRPEFCTTFWAEPSKAVRIAPFQDASPDEVSWNFGAIKAQVRAIVSGPASPSQEGFSLQRGEKLR